jgi:acyl transferase domain-containing protein
MQKFTNGAESATFFGGLVAGIENFDSSFFGITHQEAISMDPQQRLLLQVTWEALENAAIPPTSLENTRTGTSNRS